MKLTLENTDKLVTLVVNGHDIPARIWQGTTEGGIEVHCFITRVAVAEGQADSVYLEFANELREVATARPDVKYIPARLIL